jgi:prepilin-type N-terminal cleavage/methylation domain-containing protein
MKAFTLIELIVVVVILAILAIAAFVGYQAIIDNSEVVSASTQSVEDARAQHILALGDPSVTPAATYTGTATAGSVTCNVVYSPADDTMTFDASSVLAGCTV